MTWFSRRKNRSQAARESSLAYPYYVDAPGLRTLADSLGITLPVVRETSSERRANLTVRTAGVERTGRNTTQAEGHIHLNDLASELKQSAAYGDVVDVLGFIPLVNDPTILREVIRQIEYAPSGEEETHDLLARLHTAYELERARTVAEAKKEELRQVAQQNQLVILRGTFETCSLSGDDAQVCVRLTHLEGPGVPFKAVQSPADLGVDTPEIPMPDDLGIEAVLPATEAFTAAGRERLSRGRPFYGRLIGHSASFDSDTGILTCSAYAVWGMTRPSALLDQVQPYDFVEGSDVRRGDDPGAGSHIRDCGRAAGPSRELC